MNLTRPLPTATAEEKRDYFASVGKALTAANIQPGQSFVVRPAPRDSARDASRDRLAKRFPKEGTAARDILDLILKSGGVTRDMIADDLRIKPSTVNGRVVDLRRGGWIAEQAGYHGGSRARRTVLSIHATDKARKEAASCR